MVPVIFDSTKSKEKRMPHTKNSRETRNLMAMIKHAGSTHPFSTFMVHPRRIRLEMQSEEEDILLLMRKHVITNVPWFLVAILMIVAPLFLSQFPALVVLPANFRAMTLVAWYLITLGFVIEQFLSWYFNVFIVTDERVIDVDFLNLIYKNVSAAKIDNIEDVTVEMGGAIRSLLNFGTVLIQTAAERTQFEFEDVPQPQRVAKFLNEMILEEQQEELEGRVR